MKWICMDCLDFLSGYVLMSGNDCLINARGYGFGARFLSETLGNETSSLVFFHLFSKSAKRHFGALLRRSQW